MQPAAQAAFTKAFHAARAATGVRPRVRSGWRDPAVQRRLFDRAVRQHGSREKASEWVLQPDRSAHVKGIAVDVSPRSAAAWLERHGAACGICRRFANEWWHFEYLGVRTCPKLLPSAKYAGGASGAA